VDRRHETVRVDALGRRDDDHVHEILDSGVVLLTGKRVGVPFLGQVLGDRIGWKLKAGNPSEVQEI
jgi:hypothetical protein